MSLLAALGLNSCIEVNRLALAVEAVPFDPPAVRGAVVVNSEQTFIWGDGFIGQWGGPLLDVDALYATADSQGNYYALTTGKLSRWLVGDPKRELSIDVSGTIVESSGDRIGVMQPGSSSVLILDQDLQKVSSVPLPRAPMGLFNLGDGTFGIALTGHDAIVVDKDGKIAEQVDSEFAVASMWSTGSGLFTEQFVTGAVHEVLAGERTLREDLSGGVLIDLPGSEANWIYSNDAVLQRVDENGSLTHQQVVVGAGVLLFYADGNVVTLSPDASSAKTFSFCGARFCTLAD